MAEVRSDAGVTSGNGWAASSLEDLGEGYGFRKIRTALGIEAFGINALALPPDFQTNFHSHERQEEVYFIHEGKLEFEFGDGSKQVVGEGGVIRVSAPTWRKIKNVGNGDAVYVIVGGQGGYVGRDGLAPEQ